jgi:hypothetical protein
MRPVCRATGLSLEQLLQRVFQQGGRCMSMSAMLPPKAADGDFIGRFREVISDPLNLLIERVAWAGMVENNEVYLHNGNRVPVVGAGAYYGAFSQLLVINRGVHEPLEEYVFQEVLKGLPASPQMIELGAYWAHYSMWLKKLRPTATTIMVEPDPTNLAAGRANFERNGFNGEFIHAAVAKGYWELDPFLKVRGTAHLDILHVDIQGYEAELLEGSQASLGGGLVDYLFVSTHSQALHQHIVSKLVAFGYRVEVSSDFENDTTSLDGFVFASSPRAKKIFSTFTYAGRTQIVVSRADDLMQAVLKIREATL